MVGDPTIPRLGVLLVEDAPAQRLARVQALQVAGMRVVAVGAVEAATEALDADADLRVVVADIELQGEPLSGLTLGQGGRRTLARHGRTDCLRPRAAGHGRAAARRA